MTKAANFATGTTGVVDTGGKLATRCQQYRQQICGWFQWHRSKYWCNISNCLNLKVNFNEKNYLYDYYSIPKKEDFFNLPPVSTTLMVNLELQINPQIFEKKFETALMGYSGAWGKPIHEKTWSWKSCWSWKYRVWFFRLLPPNSQVLCPAHVSCLIFFFSDRSWRKDRDWLPVAGQQHDYIS